MDSVSVRFFFFVVIVVFICICAKKVVHLQTNCGIN